MTVINFATKSINHQAKKNHLPLSLINTSIISPASICYGLKLLEASHCSMIQLPYFYIKTLRSYHSDTTANWIVMLFIIQKNSQFEIYQYHLDDLMHDTGQALPDNPCFFYNPINSLNDLLANLPNDIENLSLLYTSSQYHEIIHYCENYYQTRPFHRVMLEFPVNTFTLYQHLQVIMNLNYPQEGESGFYFPSVQLPTYLVQNFDDCYQRKLYRQLSIERTVDNCFQLIELSYVEAIYSNFEWEQEIVIAESLVLEDLISQCADYYAHLPYSNEEQCLAANE